MTDCCKYHTGMLKSKIVIERLTLTPDGAGGFDESWAPDPAGGVWAHWTAEIDAFQFLSEKKVAGSLTSMSRFKAIIRFRGDAQGAPYYSARDRVIYRGREYGIESIVDPDDSQEWLELALVEGQPS